MQSNLASLGSSKVIGDMTPISISGFSLEAGLTTLQNNLIYGAGNHLIVDPLDPSHTKYTLKGHDNVITSICVSRDAVIASGQLGSPGNKNYDSPVFTWKLTMSKPLGYF